MTTSFLTRSTTVAALAFALMASASARACDQHTQAADAKDPKAVATAAAIATDGGSSSGCDQPCCAKKPAADAKAATAPAAVGSPANGAPCDAAKSTGGKSCTKKGTLVAKSAPAMDAPKAEPTPNAGTNR